MAAKPTVERSRFLQMNEGFDSTRPDVDLREFIECLFNGTKLLCPGDAGYDIEVKSQIQEAEELNDERVRIERNREKVNQLTCDLSSFEVKKELLPQGVSRIEIAFDRTRESADQTGEQFYSIHRTSFAPLGYLYETYQQNVLTQIPANTCKVVYKVHSFKYQPDAAGNLVAEFAMRYEQYNCWKTKIPEIRDLRVTFKLREFSHFEFQKTFDIRSVITPRFSDVGVIFQSSSTLDDRGGVPDWLLNLVGILTLDIGSKWIRDNYQHQLTEMRQNLIDISEEYNLPRDDFDFKFEHLGEPKFVSERGENYLRLDDVADRLVRAGTACAIKKRLN